MKLLIETLDFYKKRKKEENEKKELLNSKTDLQLLERLVKKCNDNPNLKVRIITSDGSRIDLCTYEPSIRKDYERIDGNLYEIS